MQSGAINKTINDSDSISSSHSSSDEYKLEEKPFAAGGYGEVYLAKNRAGKPFVVKKIKNLFSKNIHIAYRALREIKILRLLKHPNIISLSDIIIPKEPQATFNSLSLVFEKMDTDLYQITRSQQMLTYSHIAVILYQLLRALSYIHSAGIIHRDLKPANILINENCDVKICDFNLARLINQSTEMPPRPFQLTAEVVTSGYKAPEIMLNGQASKYGSAVDMWSIGCIFAELLMMLTNKENRCPLFSGDYCLHLSKGLDPKDWKKKNAHELDVIFDYLGTPTIDDLAAIIPPPRPIPKYFSPEKMKEPQDLAKVFSYVQNEQAIDFLKRCLVINPKKRITVQDALRHPFLNDPFVAELIQAQGQGEEKLTFPLAATLSDLDQASLDEYQQFEIQLEQQKQHGVKPTEADIRKLIWDEVIRYHPSLQNFYDNLLNHRSNGQIHKLLKQEGCFDFDDKKSLKKESFKKSHEMTRNDFKLFAKCHLVKDDDRHHHLSRMNNKNKMP